jgi:enamine deaminase RidA (YjgF/YER057c/UK114 family)
MPTREEKNEFSEKILTRMQDQNTDCLDAMVTYCEEVGLEMEVAATLVNDLLKSHLEEAFAELNYLEKSSKLPI